METVFGFAKPGYGAPPGDLNKPISEVVMEIVIIGGGAAGISVVDTIIRHSVIENWEAAITPQTAITLIEPNKQVGPGRAYNGDGDYALLNRQARFMSIRAEEPSHFIDWVRAELGQEAEAEEFVPRSLFGTYLGKETVDA